MKAGHFASDVLEFVRLLAKYEVLDLTVDADPKAAKRAAGRPKDLDDLGHLP